MAIQQELRPYRAKHFERADLSRDAKFRGGPRPGNEFPDFNLETIDGPRLRKRDLMGKPMLMTFGSVTCPNTASANPLLKQLHRDFGHEVEFVTLYVRERNPGERLGQPTSGEEKREHAHLLRERDRIPWTVAVDDVDGSFHRQVGLNPNAAYAVDENGNVAYRVLWSSDAVGLKQAIKALLRGGPYGQSDRRFVPILATLGALSETLEKAGTEAEGQFLRQAPPVYGLGKLASIFRPLPHPVRGAAAVGAVALGAFAVLGGLSRLRR
jgi:hypothetical protein